MACVCPSPLLAQRPSPLGASTISAVPQDQTALFESKNSMCWLSLTLPRVKDSPAHANPGRTRTGQSGPEGHVRVSHSGFYAGDLLYAYGVIMMKRLTWQSVLNRFRYSSLHSPPTFVRPTVTRITHTAEVAFLLRLANTVSVFCYCMDLSKHRPLAAAASMHLG